MEMGRYPTPPLWFDVSVGHNGVKCNHGDRLRARKPLTTCNGHFDDATSTTGAAEAPADSDVFTWWIAPFVIDLEIFTPGDNAPPKVEDQLDLFDTSASPG